jgi:dTDP-4-dehydrorhamnose reductase
LAKERDELRVVNDEFISPTYTADIANQILRFMECDNYGTYHVAAQSHCSWYEFAVKIFELTNTTVRLSIADPNEFPMKVRRPKYSVLENKALKSIGLDIMPHWSRSLQNYLNKT